MPTTNLAMDYIVEGQEQKHITINTNMDTIDDEVEQLRLLNQVFHVSGTLSVAAGLLEWIVPHGPGGETLTFQLTRVFARLVTAGSSTTSLQIQKSTGAGAFSGTNMLSASLDLVSSDYEQDTTSFASNPDDKVSSGNKVRINVTAAGTSAANLTVSVQMKRI